LYLQPVPAVVNRSPWLKATLPVLAEVVSADRVVEVPATLAYESLDLRAEPALALTIYSAEPGSATADVT
jgi:hypothetical protein